MRWSCGSALGALLGLLVAAAPARAAPASWRTIRSPLPGFELRYPAAWHAVRRSDGGIAISTFPLRSPDAFPARPPRAAYIVVFDYGRLRKPLPPRPASLRVPPLGSYEGFGTGSMLNFRQTGHNFQVFVAFGRGVAPAVRAQALAIVRSLRPTRPPLANDSATEIIGRSAHGKPVRAFHFGDFRSSRTILVVGCTHGDACPGMVITQQLLSIPATRANVWVIQNSRGTKAVQALSERVRPAITIWFDEPRPLTLAAARRQAAAVLRIAGGM